MEPTEDELIVAVQVGLTPDLLSKGERDRLEPGDHFTTGHCAVAAEAMLHLIRRYYPKVSAKPVCATYREVGGGYGAWIKGVHPDADRRTHWWVLIEFGPSYWKIVDPTREQYLNDGVRPPYPFGKGKGFQGRRCKSTGAQLPTKRARVVIDRAIEYLEN